MMSLSRVVTSSGLLPWASVDHRILPIYNSSIIRSIPTDQLASNLTPPGRAQISYSATPGWVMNNAFRQTCFCLPIWSRRLSN